MKLKQTILSLFKARPKSKKGSPVLFFPYEPGASHYILRKTAEPIPEGASMPVPPSDRWISKKYGKTVEEYLSSGKRDMEEMCDILSQSGVSLESSGRILEFGCGNGRMIRWLEGMAKKGEVWGTDIDATRVFWCKQNLSPSFRFITTTFVPHLPFEDHYFGFIYAGSVFSHIDDLADTWFAELRRVLRPGGTLFITVHLKNDLAVLKREEYRDTGLARRLRRFSEHERSDFNMFTIGRAEQSFVFYDIDYLRRSLEPFFRILSVTEEVRLYQNALLLERV